MSADPILDAQAERILALAKSRIWTPEDDARLTEVFRAEGWRAAINAFAESRSANAVQSRMHALKLNGGPSVNQIWKDSEIEILREIYPSRGARAVREVLPHRKIASIFAKARSLGLSRNGQAAIPSNDASGSASLSEMPWWSDEEIAILREYYPKGGALLVQSLAPRRALKSIRQKALTLGVRVDVSRTAEIRKVHAEIKSAAKPPVVAATESKPRPKAEPATVAAPRIAPVVVRPHREEIAPGACDRGNREHIRRRMGFVIAQLASELGKPPRAVVDAIVEMAGTRFAPDELARLTMDREDAHPRASEGAI